MHIYMEFGCRLKLPQPTPAPYSRQNRQKRLGGATIDLVAVIQHLHRDAQFLPAETNMWTLKSYLYTIWHLLCNTSM